MTKSYDYGAGSKKPGKSGVGHYTSSTGLSRSKGGDAAGNAPGGVRKLDIDKLDSGHGKSASLSKNAR